MTARTPCDGAGSAEAVAFRLLDRILALNKQQKTDKQALLDLYAECLQAAKGNRR